MLVVPSLWKPYCIIDNKIFTPLAYHPLLNMLGYRTKKNIFQVAKNNTIVCIILFVIVLRGKYTCHDLVWHTHGCLHIRHKICVKYNFLICICHSYFLNIQWQQHVSKYHIYNHFDYSEYNSTICHRVILVWWRLDSSWPTVSYMCPVKQLTLP